LLLKNAKGEWKAACYVTIGNKTYYYIAETGIQGKAVASCPFGKSLPKELYMPAQSQLVNGIYYFFNANEEITKDSKAIYSIFLNELLINGVME